MKKCLLTLLTALFLLTPLNVYCEDEEIEVIDDISDVLIQEEVEEATLVETIEEDEVFEEETIVEDDAKQFESFNLNIIEIGCCGDNLTYTVYSDYTMVVEGTGDMYDQSLHGLSNNFSRIRSVEVKDGVTSLGAFAFAKYAALIEINLPDSLLKIGPSAFAGCFNLKTLFIPASVSDMGGTNLASSPFCNAPASLMVFTDGDGATWNRFSTYRTASKEVNITFRSSRVDANFWPFLNKTTPRIVIPEGVTAIPNNCFMNNQSIKEVIIPSTIRSIGDNAFYFCKSLRFISGLPETMDYLGSYAFWHCYNLTSKIVVPDGITEIKEKTFANCQKVTSISIPASVTSIGYYAFEDCFSLNRFEIPADSKLEYIGPKAFRECGQLRFLYIPSTIRKIEGPAADVNLCPFFSDKNLELFMEIDGPLPDFDVKWNYNLLDVHYSSSYQDYLDAIASSTYTLHLDGNDSDNSYIYDINALYGSGVLLSNEIFTKAGFIFKGWNTAPDGSGDFYKPNSIYNQREGEPNGHTTLYAIWTSTPQQITYRINGGRPEYKNPLRYQLNDYFILAPCYKKGYSFRGWFDNPDGLGTPITNVNQCVGRMTLYAFYDLIDYQVIVDPMGGTERLNQYYDVRLNYDDGIYVGTYNVTSPALRLPRLEKPGYSFLGWLNASTGRRITTLTKGSIGDAMIIPVYAPINYRITYNYGGGRVLPYSNISKTYNIESEEIKIPDASNFVRAGYHFIGWYSDRYFSDDSLVTSIDRTLAKNITLYAKWEKN